MYMKHTNRCILIVHDTQKLLPLLALFASAYAGCAASPPPQPLTARTPRAPDAFVTVWRTDEQGDVWIPTGDGRYLYDVDWDNDGVYDQQGITGDARHHYGGRQTVTVRIRGRFDHFQGGRLPACWLLAVKQWGGLAWKSAREMFSGCSNLMALPSKAPDLRQVRDMSSMFSGATRFDQPLDHWDTSHVTNMSGLFRHAQRFNQPLEGWDTSQVTDMSGMFVGAIRFDQPLGTWNTARVTTMSRMFQDAYVFNQPLEGWDTSQVTDMSGMFAFTKAFDQPLNTWHIRSLRNTRNMFRGARAFSMPLDAWNLEEIDDTTDMFLDAREHPKATHSDPARRP